MFLFCATDAGGAKELRPVALEARRRADVMVLASRVTEPLFAEVGLSSELTAFTSVSEAEAFLVKHNIKTLVVGTTGVASNERLLAVAARTLRIPSVAVLDEWYGYTSRFSEGGTLTYLPDMICVQDELSLTLAIDDGIPKEHLRVTGSPALAFLVRQAGQFAQKTPPVPEVLLNRGGRPSILFLSERVGYAYGRAPGEKGPIGSFLGYDEDMVRTDIADALSGYGHEVLVLEKLHPAEPSKQPPSIGPNVLWRVVPSTTPILPLLWHSDHIVGMTTKALLEAAVLGRPPLSYQPGALRDPSELCMAVRLGVADLSQSKDDLAARLMRCLKEGRKTVSSPDLPCADPKAAEKVLKVAEELMRSV